MSKPFTKKYEPKVRSDIRSQEVALAQLSNFIEQYKTYKKKSALIYGSNGCGKTSAVYVLANELSYEVLEVNASDFRNKEKINNLVGAALGQQSLFGKGKIVLIDEVDGLSGRDDRGGIQALSALLSKSTHPVIMTCADPNIKQLKPIKKNAELIPFQTLDYLTVFEILKDIAKEEKITFEEIALKSLARMAGGDARAAINDLQTVAGHAGVVNKESLSVLGERDSTESIQDVLIRIFKTTNAEVARKALWNVKENTNEIMLWIDENLPKEYKKPDDLYRAYDALSKADVFNGRIRKWQHWGYLVYISALLSAGVACAKSEKYKDFTTFVQTKRLLKLWMANQKYAKKKAIAAKLAKVTHTSTTRALQSTVPYILSINKHDKIQGEAIACELSLDSDELDWMKK